MVARGGAVQTILESIGDSKSSMQWRAPGGSDGTAQTPAAPGAGHGRAGRGPGGKSHSDLPVQADARVSRIAPNFAAAPSDSRFGQTEGLGDSAIR